jgi:hypothetical protein
MCFNGAYIKIRIGKYLSDGFLVPMALSMKMAVFQVVVLCSLEVVY